MRKICLAADASLLCDTAPQQRTGAGGGGSPQGGALRPEARQAARLRAAAHPTRPPSASAGVSIQGFQLIFGGQRWLRGPMRGGRGGQHPTPALLGGCCRFVAQSCLTLCGPMGCSPPGSSVHGILQARTLETVAISFSRASS